MPKIIIVDDESIFRRGLRSMIGAMDSEWEIVGDAKDGFEALELIAQTRPDVLLTDIRMPRMDGLQLQKIAKERFPDLFSVVISGHEDFSYVQQSMRHGSKDYLMKPIEREELVRLLERLKAELQERHEHQSQQKETREDGDARSRISEHMTASLHRGNIGSDDIRRLEEIGIYCDNPYYACMVVKLDKESVGDDRYGKADPSLFQLYIRQFVQEIIDRRVKGFTFVYSESEVVAFLNVPDSGTSMKRLLETAESIRLQMKSLSKLTVTIGLSRVAASPESLPRAYREAEIALLHRLIVGGDKVLTYEHTVEARETPKEPQKWSWEQLEQAVRDGRRPAAEERGREAVAELCQQAQTPEVVHQQVCKLFISYYELSVELGVTKAWLAEKDIRTLLFDVCSITSSKELIETCGILFASLAACIHEGGLDQQQDPIARAIRYLELHYADPITLKEVADQVFLNPAYFSTLFKQRTGMTFVERMTTIRIEAAKKHLLQSGAKVSDVAEQTGFANVRHFNRVFKGETGMSPKDYREQGKGAGTP
jgi:two-component system response regulator YesN